MNITALAFAILVSATLPGGSPNASMRSHPLGPEGRATQLAEWFDEAARENDVGVWMLVALARSESGFDGTKVGKIGEVGMLQSHPRYAAGKLYLRARRNGWDQDSLDVLSIHLGADALRAGYEACGNWWQAVAWYKSGSCHATRTARNVMAIRARLMRDAGV